MPPRPPRNRDGGARGKAPSSRSGAAAPRAKRRIVAGDAATRRAPRDADASGESGAGAASAGADRLQKVLAAAGIGSRREVERWIREGRLHINGEIPALGAKWLPRDRITLDGRPVRIRAPEAKELHVLLFHRSPGETLDLKAATSRAAEHLQLPRVSGRWLAIQPMPPVDGGLEILTDDGTWAHRISQGAHALTIDYILRMRGPLTDALVEEFRGATDCEGDPMTIIKADAQYGEGFNHWLNVTVRATRSAQVRHWWGARGIIVSRLMRVRFGPIHLSRELPRGHSRAMTGPERSVLINEIKAAKLAREPDAAAARAESAH